MTPSRKKSSAEKRLARELLAYAIKRLTAEVKTNDDCFRIRGTQNYTDSGIADEIRADRAWLAKARKAVRR